MSEERFEEVEEGAKYRAGCVQYKWPGRAACCAAIEAHMLLHAARFRLKASWRQATGNMNAHKQ